MMKVYTYSEARQNLATVLDEAWAEGAVQIQRRDGQAFVVQRAAPATSPLDVQGVDTDLTVDEILQYVQEGRRSTDGTL